MEMVTSVVSIKNPVNFLLQQKARHVKNTSQIKKKRLNDACVTKLFEA